MLKNVRDVLGEATAAHTNEARMQRIMCAVHGNDVRPHIEVARLHEREAGVHRDLPQL